MTYTVRITPEARARIQAHARYISEEAQSPLNAGRWLGRALAAADDLEALPRRFPLAAEAAILGIEIRELSVGGFMLLFVVDDQR